MRLNSVRSLVLVLALAGCVEVNSPMPIESVAVLGAKTSLRVGVTQQMIALPVNPTGGLITNRYVSWQSSATSVATISASGVVTTIATGTVEITATAEGRTGRVVLTVVP